jgi:hypothetical protein
MAFKWKFLSFWPDLAGPFKERVLFLVVIEQIEHRLAAVCPIFTSSVKMHCDRPRMLCVQQSYAVCPDGWLHVVDLNFQNAQPKFGHFETWIPFTDIITKCFFKHVVSLWRWFRKVKIELYANSLHLKVCHFSWLQQSWNALKTNLHKY